MHAGWRFDEVLTVAVPQHASCVWEVFAGVFAGLSEISCMLHAANKPACR